MRTVGFQFSQGAVIRILCVGAHCDDIPIGCGGALLRFAEQFPQLDVTWVVMTSTELREQEELTASEAFLKNVVRKTVVVKKWQDGFLPSVWKETKEFFEELKRQVQPDLIFTHYCEDAHQDHRLIGELTWNTFRDHAILEYEIPKYDGDFGSPNTFMTLSDTICRNKSRYIVNSYPSQRDKHWFSEDLFLSIARLRGMEAGRETPFAEGFYCRKLVLG